MITTILALTLFTQDGLKNPFDEEDSPKPRATQKEKPKSKDKWDVFQNPLRPTPEQEAKEQARKDAEKVRQQEHKLRDSVPGEIRNYFPENPDLYFRQYLASDPSSDETDLFITYQKSLDDEIAEVAIGFHSPSEGRWEGKKSFVLTVGKESIETEAMRTTKEEIHSIFARLPIKTLKKWSRKGSTITIGKATWTLSMEQQREIAKAINDIDEWNRTFRDDH